MNRSTETIISATQKKSKEEGFNFAEHADWLMENSPLVTAAGDNFNKNILAELDIIALLSDFKLLSVFVSPPPQYTELTGKKALIPIELYPGKKTNELTFPGKKTSRPTVRDIPVIPFQDLDEGIANIEKLCNSQEHQLTATGLTLMLTTPEYPVITMLQRYPDNNLRSLLLTASPKTDEFIKKISHLEREDILEIISPSKNSSFYTLVINDQQWLGNGETFKSSRKIDCNFLDLNCSMTIPVIIEDETRMVQIGLEKWSNIYGAEGRLQLLHILQKISQTNLKNSEIGKPTIAQEMQKCQIAFMRVMLHNSVNHLGASQMAIANFILPGIQSRLESLHNDNAQGSEADFLNYITEYLKMALTGVKNSGELQNLVLANTNLSDQEKITKPFPIHELFATTQQVFEDTIKERGYNWIKCEFTLDANINQNMSIFCEKNLFIQALINFLFNTAAYAHGSNPVEELKEPIVLKIHGQSKTIKDNKGHAIEVFELTSADNGIGASDETHQKLNSALSQGLEKIKSRNGKGIALINVFKYVYIIGNATDISKPVKFFNSKLAGDGLNSDNNGGFTGKCIFKIIHKTPDTENPNELPTITIV